MSPSLTALLKAPLRALDLLLAASRVSGALERRVTPDRRDLDVLGIEPASFNRIRLA